MVTEVPAPLEGGSSADDEAVVIPTTQRRRRGRNASRRARTRAQALARAVGGLCLVPRVDGAPAEL
eukprot:13418495-Alexandrium_andersonii.AAC.1